MTSPSEAYRAYRERCLDIVDGLAPTEGERRVPCCPLWSVKDLLAHMAGVAADVLDGRTEGAATVAWADGHVASRADDDLATVAAEWARRGPDLDAVLDVAADRFPAPFFLDAFTHEWDLRHALDAPAVPDLALVAPFVDDLAARTIDRTTSAGLPAMAAVLDGAERPADGPALHVSTFEFLRLVMGRRSRRQIEALRADRPDGSAVDLGSYAEALVVWSINDVDIVDPVR